MDTGEDQLAFQNMEGQKTEEQQIMEQMVDIEDSLNLIQVGTKRNPQGAQKYPSGAKNEVGANQSNKSVSKSKSNMLQSSLDEIKEDAMDSDADDTL